MIWHMFKSVPFDLYLQLSNGGLIQVFAGNWTPETLANYLQTKIQAALGNTTQKVTYDPYQFRFLFCPAIQITENSTLNPYIGVRHNNPGEIQSIQISEFPPFLLRGPQCIYVKTNFTMNNIPVNHFLACVPINTTYGNYIQFTNYDNSEAALVLDSHIDNITVTLEDEYGQELEYSDYLNWEIVLSVQATVPEGFAPLEM